MTYGPELSDEQLMAAYVAGDDLAFRAIYARYERSLTSLVHRRVAAADDARDVVQQSFLQLHRARERFEPGRQLRPWLFTIAANLSRDERRRASRSREQLVDHEGVAPPVADPIEIADDRRRLGCALQSLSPIQREVLVLYWFRGLGLRAIAAELGLSYAAVKLRSFRARRALRSALHADSVESAA